MESQLNAIYTLIAAGVLYWMGDWLVKKVGLLGRCRIPAPLVSILLAVLCNAVRRAGGGDGIVFHEIAQMALLYVAAAALGFAVRLPKRQDGFGRYAARVLRENCALTIPVGLRTTPGQVAAMLSILAFCMFAGVVLMGSLSQLTGTDLPKWLGGAAVALMFRNTSELSAQELPVGEMDFVGRVALGMFLTTAAAELFF